MKNVNSWRLLSARPSVDLGIIFGILPLFFKLVMSTIATENFPFKSYIAHHPIILMSRVLALHVASFDGHLGRSFPLARSWEKSCPNASSILQCRRMEDSLTKVQKYALSSFFFNSFAYCDVGCLK